MRLTRFSDIGLRVLMYLAHAQGERLVTVSEVSDQFELPRNHVVKVVGALAKQGWIDAIRGRNGGIRLAVDPAELRTGGVLRILEGDREALDCEGLECFLAQDCQLRNALRQGLDAFYTAMDAYTLAQLVGADTGERIIQLHRRFTGMLPAESADGASGRAETTPDADASKSTTAAVA